MTDDQTIVSSLSVVEREALAARMDLTAPVVARMLGISRRWLRRLLKAHAAKLPSPRYRMVRRRRTRILALADVDTLRQTMAAEAREREASRTPAVKRNLT